MERKERRDLLDPEAKQERWDFGDPEVKGVCQDLRDPEVKEDRMVFLAIQDQKERKEKSTMVHSI